MVLPKRMPALDGLRGVAIFLVILTHVGAGWSAALSIYDNTDGWGPTFALPRWIDTVSSAGGFGVQMFFLVSAFTLTVRAERNRGGSLGSYAVRRLARVGPGYWVAGIVYTLLAGLGPRLWAPHGVGGGDLGIAAVFGSAWQGRAAMAVVPGGWSVACEVAFYIALPVFIRIIDGHVWRALVLTGLAIGLAAVDYSIRLPTLGAFPAFVSPIGQAPIFLLGVTAALFTIRAKIPNVRGISLVLLAIAIVGVPFSPYTHKLYLQFAALVMLAVMINSVHPSSLLASRFMRRVGEVSYSMYLIHFAVLLPSLKLAVWLFPANDLVTMIAHASVTYIVTFFLACVTYAYIERPAVQWAASRTGRAAASGGDFEADAEPATR